MAYQNIINNRPKQTGATATPNQTSNDNWFSKMNEFNQKIKEFEEKENIIKSNQSKTKKDLDSTKSIFYEFGIKRNRYYGKIRISLIHLLSQTNKYYYSKIEEINHSILRAFKKETRLEIIKESETITVILEKARNQIEECFETGKDSLLFTISFKEEEIKILQKIALNEFNTFIKELQEYQKEQPEITENLDDSSSKITQLEEQLKQLNLLLQKTERELITLKKLQKNLFWSDIFDNAYSNEYTNGTSRT